MQPRRNEDFHNYLADQGFMENSVNELILDWLLPGPSQLLWISSSRCHAVLGTQKQSQHTINGHNAQVLQYTGSGCVWSLQPTGWRKAPRDGLAVLRVGGGKLSCFMVTSDGALCGWFVDRTYLELEITLSQEQIQKYTDCLQFYVNNTLKELRRLFLVQDLVDSLKVRLLKPLTWQSWVLFSLMV